MIKDFYSFQEAIGMRESSNNYQAVNAFQFLGKFQFGKPRLWDLGYSLDGYKPHWYNFRDKKPLTKLEFLNNKELQDLIFFQHVRDCIRQIKHKGLDKHICTYVNKVKITMSGLVAGMHLGGLGSLTKWLVGVPFRNGFGTDLSSYVKLFADYDLENY